MQKKKYGQYNVYLKKEEFYLQHKKGIINFKERDGIMQKEFKQKEELKKKKNTKLWQL